MKSYVLFLLLLLPFLSVAQHQDITDALRETIEYRIENGMNTSIAIGVIDKFGTRFYTFGTKKIEGDKVNEHTIYEIGSISKVFTGILLADQVVNKKMKVDDPIAAYLPAEVKVPAYGALGPVISLGHLSDHTSSLPRLPSNLDPADPENPYADYTVDMLYEFLSSYDLPREVGSEFEYSNLAVGLLGHILALETNLTYEELLKSKITDPLTMKETAITLSSKMKSNLASGYAMGMEVKNWDLPTFDGAGAIRSSVSDMLLFLAANLNLNKSPLYPAMELSHQPRHSKAGNSIGLGWIMDEGSKETIYTHNGATGGYRAYTGFVKEEGKGVIVMTNSDIGVNDIGRYLLDRTTILQAIKPPIAFTFSEVIEAKGVKGLKKKYKEIKSKGGQYEIDEGNINTLGYQYLNSGNIEAALAVFEINVAEFPEAFNVYDSYGEALLKNEQKEEAIANYKKSLDLNPGNTNAITVLSTLGVEYKAEKYVVNLAILDTYLGTYELAPGFNIVITRKENQLFGQATGQPAFELHAKSDTEFYLTVVDAQVVFSKNAEDKIMMTLYQGGQVMPGKKI